MRRRKGNVRMLAEVFVPSAGADDAPLVDEETHEFWALHTAQGSMRILKFATTICSPAFAGMVTIHSFKQGLGQIIGGRGMLPPLIAFTFSGLLWYFSHSLQGWIKRWPVVCGSAIQVASDILYMSVVVLFPSQFGNQLMQHRVFLTAYYPLVYGSMFISYVPWPVFLSMTVPTYLGGWFIFHHLVRFQPLPMYVWGVINIASVVFLYHLRNVTLWQAFAANKALLKEREWLSNMQDSFRGILSSIFDASCTCDGDGCLLECSPQLQAQLDCSPTSQHTGGGGSLIGSNLCSFSVSDSESQRLKEFLKNAMDTARHQAATIQCSFLRKPEGVLEACLYAIALKTTKSSEDKPDGLFISMNLQSPDPETCRRVAEEPDIQDSAPDIADTMPSLAVFDDETCTQIADRRFGSKEIADDEDAVSTMSGDHVDKGTLCSFSISESMPSLVRYPQTKRLHSVCSVETQTLATIASVDAEVQTIGSAARPPVVNREALCRDAKSRRRGKAPSGKRRLLSDCFKATPSESVDVLIMLNLLQYINPKCYPGCCMKHRLLHYVAGKAAALLSSDCWDWNAEEYVQCIECGCLQEDDDDEQFACPCCNGTEARHALNLVSSQDAEEFSDESYHEGSD